MVRIIESKCVGCGICQKVCPEGFEVVNGKARVKNENAGCIKRAADSCPAGAIVLDENERTEGETIGRGRGQGGGFGRGMGQGRGLGRGRGFGRGRGRRGF
ncbi:ferredoxin [Candidatus Micrarchaeota archaeon]|nr:ferredoxin [Candidatus Micrarchaeota archaeon]